MQRMRMEEPMTTLDKRIPYYPVLMVLTQPPVITDIPLAQGSVSYTHLTLPTIA